MENDLLNLAAEVAAEEKTPTESSVDIENGTPVTKTEEKGTDGFPKEDVLPKEDAHPVRTQSIRLAVGEAITVALTLVVYAILGKMDGGVILGALLGAAVTIANFTVLAFSVDSLTKQIIESRGNKELTEEQQEEFVTQHKNEINQRVKLSYLVRNGAMVGLLVLALISHWMNPIATLIPIVMFRPILMVSEMIFARFGK